jgi:hypothetical protein
VTRKYFKSLSAEKQRKKVLDKGVYLCNRETDEHSIFLFQLDSFYIEVYFLHNNDELYSIKSFEGTQLLDPYMDRINLKSLMSELF